MFIRKRKQYLHCVIDQNNTNKIFDNKTIKQIIQQVFFPPHLYHPGQE